jgi:hypothetical protein
MAANAMLRELFYELTLFPFASESIWDGTIQLQVHAGASRSSGPLSGRDEAPV